VFKKLDFSGFCDSIGLCPGDKESPYSKTAAATLEGSNAKNGKCTICDAVQKFSKKTVSKLLKSVSHLEKYIRKGCRESSDARIHQKCVASIAKLRNFDQIKLFSGFCKKYLCSMDLPARMLGDKKSCALCKEIVKIVSTSLAYSEKLVDGILASVENTCSSFKSLKARSLCHQALADTKIAVDKFLTALQSENVCTDLKLCPGKTRSGWLSASKQTDSSDQVNRKVWNVLGGVFNQISDIFG